METREGSRRSAPVQHRHVPHWAGGMGQAALTALWALACCAALIVVGAAMSICWTIHPLLMVVAAGAVLWLVGRLAGIALRSASKS